MKPARYDLILYQGDVEELVFTVRAAGVVVDLTGWSARMQFRSSPESAVLATVEADITHAAGRVRFPFPPTLTRGLPRECVHDVEMIDPAEGVHTYLRGNVQTTREVTRA